MLASLESKIDELKNDVNKATQKRLKTDGESFIINTWLVSCALCNHCFCASPGSVAAYHGALSRAPLHFEPLLTTLGICGTLNPFHFDFVSDKTCMKHPADSGNGLNLDSLQLTFSRNQLINYKKWRVEGLDRKSSNWMNKAAEIVWNCSHGIICKLTMDAVRDVV
jgi:hypothetical protein